MKLIDVIALRLLPFTHAFGNKPELEIHKDLFISSTCYNANSKDKEYINEKQDDVETPR